MVTLLQERDTIFEPVWELGQFTSRGHFQFADALSGKHMWPNQFLFLMIAVGMDFRQ
jgi:hypothetical protein